MITTNLLKMSIVIQKQIISNVYDVIMGLQEKNANISKPDLKLKGEENDEKVVEYQKLLNSVELQWSDFVEQAIGDDDTLGTYAKLLKAVDAMDKPMDLAIQFSTIRGQFVNSEDKFINLLVEAGFEEGEDYQKITVENDKIEEELLFFSYRCLKAFVLDKDDKNMLRALLLGEEIYGMYKVYSSTFAKKPSPKTHWMVIEQLGDFDGAIKNALDDLNNPETVLKIITGTKKSLKTHMSDMKKKPAHWGNIIIPMTAAVYMSALDDVKRMMLTLKESIFDGYKTEKKASIKKANPDNKDALTGIKWEFKALSSGIAIDPTCKQLSYDDLVVKVKEFWLGTLAQKYTPLKKRSHEEYLEYVKELEALREERAGYFSAIKYNAIHCTKVAEKAKRLSKERKSTTKGKKSTPKTSVNVLNKYATDGSDTETKKTKSKSKKDEPEVEEEAKAKPTKSKAKKGKKDESDAEEEEKPKSTKSKKVDFEEEEEKPKSTKSKAKKGKKDDSDAEEEDEKPKSTKSKSKKSKKDDSDAEEEEEKPKSTKSKAKKSKKAESEAESEVESDEEMVESEVDYNSES